MQQTSTLKDNIPAKVFQWQVPYFTSLFLSLKYLFDLSCALLKFPCGICIVEPAQTQICVCSQMYLNSERCAIATKVSSAKQSHKHWLFDWLLHVHYYYFSLFPDHGDQQRTHPAHRMSECKGRNVVCVKFSLFWKFLFKLILCLISLWLRF